MFQADCNSILIGSLPLTDHRQATEMILKYSQPIPLWPQLPKHPEEGMVRQFVSGFPGLVDEGKKTWVDSEAQNFAEEMAVFYEEVMTLEESSVIGDDSRFIIGKDTGAGFHALLDSLESTPWDGLTLKGQVTGPVTTGIGIKDQDGKAILYDDNLRDMLVTMLSLKARYQIEKLRRFTGRQKVIILIDEPGLVSFGSSGFSAVSEQLVSDTVAAVIDAIKKSGGMAGVHICANGDWGPALLSDADIISFDAYFYFDNFILYRQQLISYLERGGILAWGIVPTGDPDVVARESAENLFEKWKKQLTLLSSFGFSEKTLMNQTLIAPSCGTGSLTPELAEKVLSMTSDLSKMAKEYLANS